MIVNDFAAATMTRAMIRIGNRACSLAAALLVATPLVACSERIDTHGYLPDDDLIGNVEIGVDNSNDVAEILGTPSTTATFDNGNSTTWYYIMRRTMTKSFFQEEVLEQRVVAVEFDEAGVVRSLRNYDLADGRLIEPVERETPTYGKKLGMLEQFFGNLGRLGGQDTGTPY